MTDRPRSPDITPRAPDAPVVTAPTVTEVAAPREAAPRDVPPESPPPHDERETTNMPDAPRSMVRLKKLPLAKGGDPFTGELQIGNSKYQVVDGVVDVPPWHADDARAAGYQG